MERTFQSWSNVADPFGRSFGAAIHGLSESFVCEDRRGKACLVINVKLAIEFVGLGSSTDEVDHRRHWLKIVIA